MITEKIKTSQRLEQILLNFIDVLRINILMVDTAGNPVLVPKTSGYGWDLASSRVGILQHLGTSQFMSDFQAEGNYLKFTDVFGLQNLAIPVSLENHTVGYIIVGPVVLNKRLEPQQYQTLTQQLGFNFSDFMGSLNEIRVVSFNSLKSILDLLSDLSQYAIKVKNQEAAKPNIYMILLDLAMALTQAECGSIMLFDKSTNELSIEVHKGLSAKSMAGVRVKLGEGIAGLAAEQKTPFVINDKTRSSNRLKHLLKKPELKCAVVLPIIRDYNNEVLGVINVSTHQGNSRLATQSEQMLKTLTNISSSTLEQIFA